jgi:hypothetical protein
MRYGLLFVFAISCVCFDRPCFAQAPSPQPPSDLSQFYKKLEQRRSQNLLGGPLTDDSYELVWSKNSNGGRTCRS